MSDREILRNDQISYLNIFLTEIVFMRICAIVLILFVNTACSGSNDGPTGPQQQTDTIPNIAQGATGSTETAGPAQTSGTSGTSGTSVVPGSGGSAGVYNSGTTDLNWADVIEGGNLYDNIYAIYYVPTGTNYVEFIGTGFAAGFSNVLWTNAHVVYALFDSPGVKAFDFRTALVRRSGTKWADRSRPSQMVIDSVRFVVHPDYDGTTNSEDVAAFVFPDEPFRHEPLPSLLPERFADDLRVGQPVGTLGFPGELSDVTGPEQVVTPTFKPGTLSAFRSLNTGAQNRRMLQYNLTTTGGTSGSPVFDHLGFIVGINHASHVGREFVDAAGDTVRLNTANASYAIRVDALHELVPPIYNGPASVRRVVNSPLYPYATYQPVPE